MKKFLFSLEKILDFKNQSFDILVGEMQQLRSGLQQVENQIAETENKYEFQSKRIHEEFKAGITLPKLVSYKEYLNGLTKQLDQLKRNKIHYEKLIERKKDQIIEMKSEIAGLEKLKEKQFFQYQKDMMKMQELSIEEFVSRNS